MFYALATNPEFWKKRLNLFVALAPVVNLKNSDSFFIKFAWKTKISNTVTWIYRQFGILEMFPRGTDISDGGLCQWFWPCRVSM